MKNFALQLEGCSKEDRKKVIKLAKSVGFKWGDGDRFKSDKWDYLAIYTFFSKNLLYSMGNANGNEPLYQMPRDWNKIQEALGVEPKRGKIYVVSDRILRFKNRTYPQSEYQETDVYSQLCDNGNYYGETKEVFVKEELIEATPEEEAELIKAEHANGVHWDGDKMVEIPEYVEVIDRGETYDIHPLMEKEDGFILGYAPTNGSIWLVERIERNANVPIAYVCFNGENRILIGSSGVCASTKEAYEVQQKFKLEIGKWAEIIEPSELEKLKAENERLKAKLNKIRTECDA